MSATAVLISMLPILTLTLLQFSGGRTVRLVALFSLLPVVFSLIYTLDSGGDSPSVFLTNEIVINILTATLLPLATLMLATSAFGDEIEDRTLVYLVLKPVSRLRIIIEKYLAVVLMAVVALWAGWIITWLVAGRGDALDSADVMAAGAGAIVFGVAGYGAVFLLISLLTRRALVVGIFYILIWESLLSRPDFLGGAWVLSIRRYTQSIYARLLGQPEVIDGPVQIVSALIVFAVIIAVSLLLATARLRRMDLE